MPRPKANYSLYVSIRDGKWTGFWHEYRDGKRFKRQRALGIPLSADRDTALNAHRKWVIRHVEANVPAVGGYSLTSEEEGLSAVRRGAMSLPAQGIRIANIGTVSELLVCADLINRGYSVFRSVSPNAACDLIAYDEKSGRLIRVEVKTAKIVNGLPEYPLQRLEAGKFDITAAVSRSGEICYQGTTTEVAIELCNGLWVG